MLRSKPGPNRTVRHFAWVPLAAIALATTPAQAGSFDDAGLFTFDPAAVFTQSFDDFDPPTNVSVIDSGGLEGDAFLRIQVGEDEDPARLVLGIGAGKAAYTVRAFVRSEGSWHADIHVTYDDAGGVPFTYAALYPTGRMTSDGWVELASSALSIDADRSPRVELTVSAVDVELDAVEVVPAPGAFLPDAACSGLESNACAPGQFCMHGRCYDGNPLVPPLPSVATRDRVVDAMMQKVWVFFGGAFTRGDSLQAALASLDGLRDAPDAWSFWNGVARAINQLQDGHTRPYGLLEYLTRGGRVFPVCLVEGEADLSNDQVPSTPPYPDVLVSHVGPEKNLGLKAGDRLVSVDGLHPIAWAKGLLGHSWRFGVVNDPEVTSAYVEFLSQTIPAFATTVEFIRCSPTVGSCSQPETIAATEFGMDTEDTVVPKCDHRPAYHLAQGNPDAITHEVEDVYFGLLADSEPGEELYGMIWNDTVWQTGPAPWEPAYSAFRASAKGVVLDHRTGNGGTLGGASFLTELSRPRETMSVWLFNTTLGVFDPPFSQSEGQALFDLLANDPSHTWTAGSDAPREDIRIAVLLARDGSGSDIFPSGVKGSANTRLFGRRTMGAFSTFLTFETSAYFGWRLASGDFIGPSGAPMLGHGVEPDEELLPRQSDLLVGVDTVYERALQWVRCGDGGCP